MKLPKLLLLTCVLVGACGPSSDNKETDGGPTIEIVALTIVPADVTLEVKEGVVVEQAYAVSAEYSDGTISDVTSNAVLSVNNLLLGSFGTNEVFETSGLAGGKSEVRATYEGAIGSADITVTVENTRIEDSAPMNSPGLFQVAQDEPQLSPTIVYPADNVYVPPNLGVFEVHWTTGGATNLYEVTLSGEFSTTRLYTTATVGGNAFASFTPQEWKVVGASEGGSGISVKLRALNTAQPELAGTAMYTNAYITQRDIEGGIYYWASSGTLPGGVYRHDMSRPGEPAEAFYTTGESPDSRCVACHVLSRDGSKMAVTYDGGDGAASIVDVATRTPTLATDRTFEWNFATFEPSGDRIVTVKGGSLSLRDVATGDLINTVPTNGNATHADFAPSGDKLVYSERATAGSDWSFTNGSLSVVSFDAGSALWGTPTTIYTPPSGMNAFYPSWSPDGEWILFNQSTAGSYDVASAELYIMRVDGSVAPFRLNSPNVLSGLTNSWARWAPFSDELNGEPFFWMTFSSKRTFGVRLPAGTPQIWMAPFFPALADAGEHPALTRSDFRFRN